jgi:putative ABC transport system ATP-binding protein
METLSIDNVYFAYRDGGKVKPVLQGLSYDFVNGNVHAIVGKSGSGKTTLLSLIAGLNTPDQGKVLYKGKDLAELDRYKYRSQDIGVVFQSFNLLPHLTAIENIMLSLDASGKKFDKPKREIAAEVFKKVELDQVYENQRILKLSGGEQQRVAIARALAYNPDIILADEPTGNLDPATGQEIMRILVDLAHQENKCVIIVTHSAEIAESSDRLVRLSQ